MAPVNILRFISILPPSTAGADQIIRVTLAAEWDPWGLEIRGKCTKIVSQQKTAWRFKPLFQDSFPPDLLYWPGVS